MRLEAFALERLQSTWENRVAWNLAESGVHPLRVEELAETAADREALFGQHLGYTQTNGTPELRSLVAAMYPGATAEHVEITNGGSEANFIVSWRLLEPGDEMVMMTPNYMQLGGIARALGAVVRSWPLVETASRWAPDLDALDAMVSSATKIVAICNPNNPTGARLTPTELDRICAAAARVGAWVLSDEIYRGAELDGIETASVWGRYERCIVTSGLSKAYGLPGLRIGWVVGPPPLVDDLWGVHDYTTIAPGALNDRLARIALEPAHRAKILARTRGIVGANYPLLRRWLEARSTRLSHVPPEAGAIALVRFNYDVTSTELVERIRNEKSVLLVPGAHFDMEGYLRIGFGEHPGQMAAALDLVAEVLDGLA